jgi:flagellar biosynthetic protein FliR
MDISQDIIGFLLAFARISAFIFMLPFLKSGHIPVACKLVIAAAIAAPVYQTFHAVRIDSMMGLVGQIICQLLIGIFLAYVVDCMFSIVTMAGSLFDLDIGFSQGQMLDPTSNNHNTLIANLFSLMFTYIFMSTGGLQGIIAGIEYTFQITDPSFHFLHSGVKEQLLITISAIFSSALQLAVPLMVSMFMVNLIMIIMGKSSPQTNVFLNVVPIKIALGFLFLYVTLPFIGEFMIGLQSNVMESMMQMAGKIIIK